MDGLGFPSVITISLFLELFTHLDYRRRPFLTTQESVSPKII